MELLGGDTQRSATRSKSEATFDTPSKGEVMFDTPSKGKAVNRYEEQSKGMESKRGAMISKGKAARFKAKAPHRTAWRSEDQRSNGIAMTGTE